MSYNLRSHSRGTPIAHIYKVPIRFTHGVGVITALADRLHRNERQTDMAVKDEIEESTKRTAGGSPEERVSLTGRQWLKHLMIYAVGIASQSALSFFVIPIYTRQIAPNQYGILELLSRTQDILGLVVMSGFAVAAIAFYQFEAVAPERQRKVFSTALAGVLANSIAVLLFVLPFSSRVSRLLFRTTEYTWAVEAFACLLPLELVFQVGLVSIQARIRSGLYVLFSVGRLTLGIVVNLVLVWWLRWGLKGIICASLLHTGLSALAIAVYVFRQSGFHFDWDLWKSMLRYGLPFVLGGMFRLVLDSGDRYFLMMFRGSATVGIYGISYKIVLGLMMLVLAPFTKIWGALMIEVGNSPSGPGKIARATTYLAGLYLYPALVLSLLCPALLRLLTGHQYWEAFRPVPILLLAYLFWSLSTVADTGFYAKKKVHLKPWFVAIAGIFCFASYALLIPRWGVMGAAWSAVLAFGILVGLTMAVGQRYLPVPYEFGRLAVLLGLSIALYLGGRLIITHWHISEIAAASVAAIVFPCFLGFSGWFRTDERLAIGQCISALYARCTRSFPQSVASGTAGD